LKTISRRAFIGGSAAAAAMTIVPASVLGGQGRTAPSEKLNIAGIGVGGQGRWDIDNVNSQNIVALCDVDWDRAADTFKSYPKARKYRDFRVMLEKEKGIDAVVVATPTRRGQSQRPQSRRALPLRWETRVWPSRATA